MSRTLNQLIAAAIDGGEEVEETTFPNVEVEHHEAEKVASTNFDDTEKLASALEFIGRRGVGTLLVKEASASSAPTGVGTNASQKPGGSAKSVDTSSTGKGTHHPALGSSSGAIGYDKREKAKKVAPALASVLKTTAFADPTLKENLSAAAGKGDKNIHSKKAHDLEAVKAELERRAAGGV